MVQLFLYQVSHPCSILAWEFVDEGYKFIRIKNSFRRVLNILLHIAECGKSISYLTR